MLKYQLYDSRFPRHPKGDVAAINQDSCQTVDDNSTSNGSDSAIRRQISRHPAIALNVGIATGFLLGWLVKR